MRKGNNELLEQGVFKLKGFGTGKYGRVLGEVFVSPDFVGDHIQECISNPESKIDLSSDGWVSVNDILMEEGRKYEYDGGKKKSLMVNKKGDKIICLITLIVGKVVNQKNGTLKFV